MQQQQQQAFEAVSLQKQGFYIGVFLLLQKLPSIPLRSHICHHHPLSGLPDYQFRRLQSVINAGQDRS